MAEETLPGSIRLDQAVDVTPRLAPVRASFERTRAGVWLTWGVLGLMLFFIGWSLFAAQSLLSVSLGGDGKLSAATLAADTVAFRLLTAEQTQSREFWLKTVQLILGNVLLPVLTALLGYVFGTQSTESSGTGK